MSGLYDRLGVRKNASPDEIRSAYRKLAREHHPDKGGDPEKFKEIQEAHEVLTDEQRRQVYDATGSVNEQQQHQGAPQGFPFSDIFANMFGGGMPQHQHQHQQQRGGKGPSNMVNVPLKLENFYRGFEVTMNFKQVRKCRDCAASYTECRQCGGSGMRIVMQRMGPMTIQTQAQCDGCGGKGIVGSSAGCSGCGGRRMTERERSLTAKITQGMRVGERMVFEGECSETEECDTPGDIVVCLQLQGSRFEWKGDDLWCRHAIAYNESILGFEVTMTDHPGGTQVYRWTEGPIISGTVLTMMGGGMPKKVGGGFGNLKIVVDVQAPSIKLSIADREALEKIFGSSKFGASSSYQVLSCE